MRTLLAKECAACLQRSDNASLGLSQAFKDHFLGNCISFRINSHKVDKKFTFITCTTN